MRWTPLHATTEPQRSTHKLLMKGMKHFPDKDKVCFAIAQLFATSAERVQQKILGALVPHSFELSPMICYWPEYEMRELSQFVHQFQSYLKDDIPLQEKCRLMILVYCHIMEAEFPSTVIWNLLRVMKDEAPSWTFYGINKNGEEFSCEFPEKRYSEIKKLSEKAGMVVGNVLYNLWHNKLRNAFYHAQYIIHGNGDFLGGLNISPITSNAIRPSDTAAATGENPYNYSFLEVKGLFERTLNFLDSFIQSYGFIIEPYKTGKLFDIPTGHIQWDNVNSQWVTK